MFEMHLTQYRISSKFLWRIVSLLFAFTHRAKYSSQRASLTSVSSALSNPYLQDRGPLATMPDVESADRCANELRRVAREFLPDIPQHPFLDPNFPEADAPLVPRDLAPRGRLNWELPREARMNLHIMLNFTEETDKLLDEFHAKVPTIDEVIEEWCAMKCASPTTIGSAKLRAQVSCKEFARGKANNVGEQRDDAAPYLFNMVKHLASPGRSDVVYLTDGLQDKEDKANTPAIPDNLRAVDWLDFDGSYVHLADAQHQAKPKTANSEFNWSGPSMRMNITPLNRRTTEWPVSEGNAYIARSISSPEPESHTRKAKPLGPFEEFWRDHGGFQGFQMVVENHEPSSNHLSEFQPQWPESMGRCKDSGEAMRRLKVPLTDV